MADTNRSIKCRVDSCRHHSKDFCTLSDIVVGQQCNCATECCETECLSFERE